ncbi:hypothetical protein SAMN05414139_09028 [Burkholderia sp. D7]|nr:hypothetical protein SAMN05414139_09028 [Burkholderia sp. D7]
MNIAAIDTRTPPHQGGCEAAACVTQVGKVVFAAAVAALEARLGMPVQPFLDGYLRPVLSRVVSNSAAIFRLRSF